MSWKIILKSDIRSKLERKFKSDPKKWSSASRDYNKPRIAVDDTVAADRDKYPDTEGYPPLTEKYPWDKWRKEKGWQINPREIYQYIETPHTADRGLMDFLENEVSQKARDENKSIDEILDDDDWLYEKTWELFDVRGGIPQHEIDEHHDELASRTDVPEDPHGRW